MVSQLRRAKVRSTQGFRGLLAWRTVPGLWLEPADHRGWQVPGEPVRRHRLRKVRRQEGPRDAARLQVDETDSQFRLVRSCLSRWKCLDYGYRE